MTIEMELKTSRHSSRQGPRKYMIDADFVTSEFALIHCGILSFKVGMPGSEEWFPKEPWDPSNNLNNDYYYYPRRKGTCPGCDKEITIYFWSYKG
jgi:hypothetical protein